MAFAVSNLTLMLQFSCFYCENNLFRSVLIIINLRNKCFNLLNLFHSVDVQQKKTHTKTNNINLVFYFVNDDQFFVGSLYTVINGCFSC